MLGEEGDLVPEYRKILYLYLPREEVRETSFSFGVRPLRLVHLSLWTKLLRKERGDDPRDERMITQIRRHPGFLGAKFAVVSLQPDFTFPRDCTYTSHDCRTLMQPRRWHENETAKTRGRYRPAGSFFRSFASFIVATSWCFLVYRRRWFLTSLIYTTGKRRERSERRMIFLSLLRSDYRITQRAKR